MISKSNENMRNFLKLLFFKYKHEKIDKVTVFLMSSMLWLTIFIVLMSVMLLFHIN
jgi:hypothetical protein